MTPSLLRKLTQCVPRIGAATTTPEACDGGVLEHVACGFFQNAQSLPGPDIEIYNTLAQGPFNQTNFVELDRYALNIPKMLDLIQQVLRNCTSHLPRRIYTFEYQTPFKNYVLNPISGIVESTFSTLKTELVLGGVGQGQAKDIGTLFDNRMSQFRPSPTPSSKSESLSGLWIGLIIFGAFVVIWFALFLCCRSRKSSQNSLSRPLLHSSAHEEMKAHDLAEVKGDELNLKKIEDEIFSNIMKSGVVINEGVLEDLKKQRMAITPFYIREIQTITDNGAYHKNAKAFLSQYEKIFRTLVNHDNIRISKNPKIGSSGNHIIEIHFQNNWVKTELSGRNSGKMEPRGELLISMFRTYMKQNPGSNFYEMLTGSPLLTDDEFKTVSPITWRE